MILEDGEVAVAGGLRIALTTSHEDTAGDGPWFVLAHGLTATRRYVVMGSRTLERGGARVIAYDARGHGRSAPAPRPDAYGYDALADDMLAVMDACGVERAVLAGASMGAHTALAVALRAPERVLALGLITPGHDPDAFDDPGRLAHWDRLADGLRDGGVEGFIAAYDLPPAHRETILTVLRQRMAAHEHPLAVADALRAVPRSAPFRGWDELAALNLPTVVIASRDEADPEHPLALAQRYAESIPSARLAVEEPGGSPLAWQGGRVSRLLGDLVGFSAG